jgi:rubrerythrin
MSKMYKKLQKDEEGHLSRLEELYESIYLKEM